MIKVVRTGAKLATHLHNGDRTLSDEYFQKYTDAMQEHLAMLEDAGWSLDAYELGAKYTDAQLANMAEYKSIVKAVLRDKRTVAEAQKEELARWRIAKSINAKIHCIALEEQGWTLDDWEHGRLDD